MKISRSKTTAALTALFLALTIAVTMIALPLANAHTPAWTVPTWSYITVSPNPVGVGQTVLIVFWVNWVPPGAGGVAGDRWRNLIVEVTKPDGAKETLGPFISDPIGGGWTSYTPDQLGTYTLKFNFPGQIPTLYGPTGLISVNPSLWDYINDTFQPSSATTTLTVQQEPILAPPAYPLPTEYWTRPIEAQNTPWASIASNWLVGAGYSDHYNVQPYGIAPNSPHIMWTKPLQDGGIAGGNYTIDDLSYYAGESYEIRFRNPMIIHGRLYYDLPLGSSNNGGGYLCVDLRTGETRWWANWTTALPSFGQLFDYESENQHGVLPTGILWRISGTTWQAYDSLTGSWLYNLTDVPSGFQLYGPSGEIVRYVISYNAAKGTGWLGLWNNSQHSVGLEIELGTSTNAYQWRPIGKTVNMSTAYSWNVTIPALPNVGGNPTVQKVIPEDLLLGTFSIPGSVQWISQKDTTWTVFAISLKPQTRGQLMWIKNYTTTGNVTRMWGLVDKVNRVFTFVDQQTMKWSGYSMDDGSLLWGPVGDETAWNYYSYGGMGGYHAGAQSIANGILYAAGTGGIIYAYNIKTGKLLWTFGNGGPGNSTHTYLGDAYANWPIFIGSIADGKIYTFTYEHSNNKPSRKGAKIYCINATTGEQLWALMGWPSSTSHANRAGVIADGYMAYFNTYDSQVYCIGKGPSATTVSASPEISVHGSSVLIKGRVVDTAAGTKQQEQAARFPNGVPAMSDASQSEWMEYVYMQKPMPTSATGVEVSLDTLDPNGNFVHIGTVTSDASGMFKKMFTPEVPGEYTIIASFQGTESYYSSYAETAIGVEEAPPATAAPEYPQPVDPTMTIIYATIAMIIAIVLVGIWIKRK